MMKRLVAILFFLTLLSGAIVVIAPSFMDWDQHREKIAGWFTRILGVEVSIAGHIDFSVLPHPALTAHDVTLGAFLKIDQAELEMPIGPLLEGRIDITRIHILAPVLDIALLPDNWKRAGGDRPALALGAITADKISLDRLMIEHGRLVKNGKETGIDDLRFIVAADTLTGPFTVDGEMMINGQIPAKFGLTSGVYEEGKPLALNMQFMPGLDLPEVKFNGIADFSGKAEIQGEVLIGQGSLVRYYDLASFGFDLPWMREKISGRAQLLARRGNIELQGLRLDFPGTAVEGRASLSFPAEAKLHLTAELKADHFTARAGSFFDLRLPYGFTSDLDLAVDELSFGKQTWFKAVFSGSADEKTLTIKSASAAMRDGTKFDVAGTYTPAARKLDLFTQGKFKNFPAFAKNISNDAALDWLSLQMPVLSGQAKLAATPEGFVLSEINAGYGESDKLSGEISSDGNGRTVTLAISTLDATSLLPQEGIAEDKFQNLIKDVSNRKTSFDLSVSEVKLPKFSAIEMHLKGASGSGGLSFESISAKLPYGSSVFVSGKTEGLFPLAGMDFQAQVKTTDYALLVKGLDFLPLPKGSGIHASDIALHLTGDEGAFGFTFKANADAALLDMKGQGAKKESWQAEVNFSDSKGARHAFGLFGLEPTAVLRDTGKISFEANLDRKADGFSFTGIKASAGDISLTGKAAVSETGDGVNAELDGGALKLEDIVDFNAFALPEKTRVEIALSAQSLTWQDMAFDRPKIAVSYTPDIFEIKSMDAGFWDGKLSFFGKMRPASTKGNWEIEAHFNGNGLNGEALRNKAGISGLTLDKSDFVFDVSGNGKTQDEVIASLSGTASLSSESGSISHFSPVAVPAALAAWDRISDHLPGIVINAVRQGQEKFKGLELKAALSKGEAKIDPLSFTFDAGRVDATGKVQLAKRRYELTSHLSLSKPEAIPTFGLHLQGAFDAESVAAVSDIKPLEDFVRARYEGALEEELKDQIKQRDDNDRNVVNDILDRLEEDRKNAEPEPIGPFLPADNGEEQRP